MFHNIIGQTKSMQEVYTRIEKFANTGHNLLISGETGSGKELAMEAIHKCSRRADKPLIRVNCAALAETIFENELFGHVKGAFTGALHDKTGRFELADQGTIFLDEISEIGIAAQAKLLRVLEDKEFERVGDTRTISVDTRIIAATNQDLNTRIKEKRFRADLYYRLNMFAIHIPPLRMRKEDIPLLTGHFIEICNRNSENRVSGISDDVMQLFFKHPWYGNVRELKNTIEYACTLSPGGIVTKDYLPPAFFDQFALETDSNEPTAGDEKETILKILKRTDWNKAKTARILGVSRTTLYNKIARYQINSRN